MPKRVNISLAKMARNRRNRRVKSNKDKKIEARIEPAMKARFAAACRRRNQKMAAVLCALAEAYAAAVEEGRSTDIPIEVRTKPGA